MKSYAFDVVVGCESDAVLVTQELERLLAASPKVIDHSIYQPEVDGLTLTDIVVSISINLVTGATIHVFRDEIEEAYKQMKSKLKRPSKISYSEPDDGTASKETADEHS